MFEKIIANLPYNPALIKELGFYARRARKEETIRRLGLVFIVLAFFVQFFAFISPPQPSLADSTNDMINGGFSTVGELVANCQANIKDYATILKFYGLNCSDLAFGKTVSLVSISHNKQLFSMGWNPQGSIDVVTKKPTDEHPINIPGIASPLYWRYLWSSDYHSYSTYQAVKVESQYNSKTYYILYTCGNLVSVGLPAPYVTPTPKPKPTPIVNKSTIPQSMLSSTTQTASELTCGYSASYQCGACTTSSSNDNIIGCIQYSLTASDITQNWSDTNDRTAQPGDKIIYSLTAYNSGQTTIHNFIMQDNLSYVIDYATIINNDQGTINNNDIISWPAATIAPHSSLKRQLEISIMNPLPQNLPSSSDHEFYDHIMTNVYGNSINIYLPSSPITTLANTTTKVLPNTKPLNSLIIAVIIVLFAGYFFVRSKLLALETTLAIQDNNGGEL